jgi:minor extracellular serine protease Vpr
MRVTPRRVHIGLIASLGLCFGLFAVPASADDGHELAPIHPAPTSADDGVMVNETTGLWFVELEGAPVADGTSEAELSGERDDFRAEASERGLQYEERMEFDTLFNGFSIEMDDSQLGTLQETPGVKAIYPVVQFDIPDTTEVTPDLATALMMTGADIAQSELGFTGDGVRVAVMDTGIDYNHPDLGGPGPFPTSRVIAGHDFVGDDYNASSPDPGAREPQPDQDPLDCNGHGTHVSGIVGADGEVTGVAPGVAFGAYKVFGCDGSTTADIMISAMEMALADDMDVLNMSIGSAHTWPQYPTGAASDRLVRRGMSVVASIGNEGATGLYGAGAPGLGEDVIGVAAFDNSHVSALTFNVNPSGEQVPYLTLASAQEAPTEGESGEVVYVGRGCVTPNPDANPPIPPGGDPYLDDPEGKVALIVRGDCTFEEKYQRAVDEGASGVVVHNQLAGLFAGSGITDRGVFGIGISDEAGLHLRDLLDGGEDVTLSWTDERVNAANPTGGLISSFSSYGLSPDLRLKPDIGAPGGLIRSTYPLDQGGYAIISGTSMASPHVAGGVALLLEDNPRLRASEIRTILQNSADPAVWWGNPGLGFLDNVHRQGAGMLDIAGAVEAGTHVSPGKLSLGESEGSPSQTELLRITNTSSETVTYQLSHEPALGTHGSTFGPGFNDWFADVSFSQESVTLRAGRSTTVRATITAPEELENLPQQIYGGYLVIGAEDGEDYRVPYAGYVGDYQAIDAVRPIVGMDEDGNEVIEADLPWLTKLTACEFFIGLECVDPAGSYENQPDGATFTMAEIDGVPDIPYVIAHFDHQVEKLEMTVLNAETGRPVNPVFNHAVDVSFERRNSGPGAFFAYPWDGSLTRTIAGQEISHEVDDGAYILELSALKAGGDAGNDDHWETWTSPVITIDRS